MDGLMTLPRERHISTSVRDLLLSFGYQNPETLQFLAARLPVSADAEAGEARAAIGQWFAQLLGLSQLDTEVAFHLGRAAFVMSDAADRWPMALLADEVPSEFTTHLRQALPTGCPPDMPAVMAIQPLDSPALLFVVSSLFRRRPRPAQPA